MSSRFVGVVWVKARKAWRAYVCVGGRTITLGNWQTERAAAEAHDRAMRCMGLCGGLNFPRKMLAPAGVEALRTEARKQRTGQSSGFLGVWFDPRRLDRPWQAKLEIGKRGCSTRLHLGRWPSERKAAEAYDRAARHYLRADAVLNFPGRRLEAAPADQLIAEARAVFKAGTTSKYRGVTAYQGRWQARIMHERKTLYIGTYDAEQDAARAYDAMARRLHGRQAKVNLGG